MTWSNTVQGWATFLMGPSISAIIIGTIFSIGLPLLLHFFVFRSNAENNSLPTFLLVGPSGSGKTALLTQLERGHHAATHMSQAPLAVEASLPATATTSSQSGSANDPTLQGEKRFRLIDTPGHAKLRHYALDQLTEPESLKGIIFMVDATSLSEAGHDEQLAIGLKETAEYLYDILLLLQRRSMTAKSSRAVKEVPVLIAANKLDLFTALPTPLVRTRLEGEITRIRESRSKGLLDSGIDMGDSGDGDEEKDWLGERDDKKFTFSQMSDMNVPIDVAGGYAAGPDGADVEQWRGWIGSQL